MPSRKMQFVASFTSLPVGPWIKENLAFQASRGISGGSTGKLFKEATKMGILSRGPQVGNGQERSETP